MNKSILFVMEKNEALETLQAMLEKEGIKTLLTEGCEPALTMLESEEIDMIISDAQLPSGDGFELLDKVKKQYPEVLRIAMCSYSDSRKALGAIENNVIKSSDKLVKILGVGELTIKTNVSAQAFSAKAKEAIEKNGGKAIVIK